MYRHYLEEIEKGKKGLSRIINDSKYLELIDRFQVNEDVRERIRKTSFSSRPTFTSKVHDIWPGSRDIVEMVIDADEIVIKWFLLLDSVSSSWNQFYSRVLQQLDDRVLKRFNIDRYRLFDQFDLSAMTDEEMVTLVDDVIDVERFPPGAYNKNYWSWGEFRRVDFREWEHFRQTVSLYTLSTGYDLGRFADVLLEVIPSIPFIFASSRFISIMTGRDETEVLNEIIQENGVERFFDEIPIMKKENDVRESLIREKIKVENELSSIKERIRHQDTKMDILADSFGMNLPECEVLDRVSKCNDSEHRAILGRLESITGKELSFLDEIDKTGLPIPYSDLINREFWIFISEKEVPHIKTVENLIDTIIVHKRFIEQFEDAVINGRELDLLQENDPYDIDVRIKEIECSHHCTVDRYSICSLDDLKQYVQNVIVKEERNKHEYLEDLIDFLTEKFVLERGEVTLDSDIITDLDPLSWTELFIGVENRYGIKISDWESMAIHTVRDLFNLIYEKLS